MLLITVHEGLLTEPEGYFTLPFFAHPVAGNAVIVGTNSRTGDDISIQTDLLEKVKESIIFFRPGETHVEPEIRFIPLN